MSRLDIDVIVCNDGPSCLHGPALLFSRLNRSGEEHRYFACSAHRDKKFCSFYKLESEWLKNKTSKSSDEAGNLAPDGKISSAKLQLGDGKIIHFCFTCGQLVRDEDKGHHKTHKLIYNPTQDQLSHPSTLLSPLENPKSEAQYLFSNSTVKVINDNLVKAGVTKILCVGAPRVHENVTDINSLMLDIDTRYDQFYTDTFLNYNMFNHHFFAESDSVVYKKFLPGGKLAVVIDPPFGGRVEVVATTLKKIQADWRLANGYQDEELTVLWMFPYFMGRHIIKWCPQLHMLDMRVDYDNHALFKNGPTARKHGSPVRIFTNIPASDFILSGPDYRFCDPCKSYVSVTNQHCEACDSCTSKDGRPYVHCDKCSRCVKCSYEHCAKCDMCHLVGSQCTVNSTTCHLCNMPGHKRRDCHLFKTTQENKTTPQESVVSKKLKADVPQDKKETVWEHRKPMTKAAKKRRRKLEMNKSYAH